MLGLLQSAWSNIGPGNPLQPVKQVVNAVKDFNFKKPDWWDEVFPGTPHDPTKLVGKPVQVTAQGPLFDAEDMATADKMNFRKNIVNKAMQGPPKFKPLENFSLKVNRPKPLNQRTSMLKQAYGGSGSYKV